jgi:asparagine synthase (glutamine-hydrolysing)
MCGICGIVGSENRTEVAACLARMLRAIIHRGPDGEGMFVTAGAGIGMRRLSIIDLPGGQQPIWNESGTLAVIFNGEIYNFRELRCSLESSGHVFRTKSDTETIVHAYEEWGRECVQHLRGMFVFAIAEVPDGETGPARRVFLARDRMGIKPLYYGVADGSFFFASEVRALLASGCFARRLSISAVSSYLLFGAVGEPLSLIEGIHSLPPGHCGYVSCDTAVAEFRPEPYWNFAEAAKPATNSQESPAVQVRAALEDSVRSHLAADVPLGIFLSSGIDSTAIAAIASKQHARVKTFTVAFSEEEFSEGAIARTTAESLGTDHSEFLLTAEEMRLRLGEAIAAFDQPSADGINTYFVSWAARQAGLKVALSGLGSDEIFGGYSTFAATPRIAMLVAFARYAPQPVRAALSNLVQFVAEHGERPDAMRKVTAAFLHPTDFPHPYFFTRALFPPRDVAQLLSKTFVDWTGSKWWSWMSDVAADTANLGAFTSVSWLETRSYLVNMLLRDTDTMSMCHSLEVRVPFLDEPLVRTALSCSETVKNKKGTRKALLIEALGDSLPKNTAKQLKRTFTLPWEVWLRGPLRTQVEAGLSNCDVAVASVIDITEVKRVWEGFLAGRTSWSRPWSIFVLNEWAKRNLAIAPDTTASVKDKAAAPAIL